MIEFELFTCTNEDCGMYHKPVTTEWTRSDPRDGRHVSYSKYSCRECHAMMTDAESVPPVMQALLEADAAMLNARIGQ